MDFLKGLLVTSLPHSIWEPCYSSRLAITLGRQEPLLGRQKSNLKPGSGTLREPKKEVHIASSQTQAIVPDGVLMVGMSNWR